MFQRLNHRAGHYALLITVAAVLYLPNLGAPSLWDIDEGNNAECAWEMLAADNWVIPTFNFTLRDDKPVLLYWLQIHAYRCFGVNEFAARLPSALAALLTVLLAYELGRRLFDAATGLLSGLVLASAVMFSAAAHFANPDALLNLCTVLTFLFAWHGFERPGWHWFALTGASMGLAMLAKGPVGLVLPAAVGGLFLLWSRQFHCWFDRRVLWGVLAFVLVAAPWYGWVGAETKGEFLRGFLLKHNVDRYRNPMEHHGGPIFYYAVILAVGFAPWSVFLGLAGWSSVEEWKKEKKRAEKEDGAAPVKVRWHGLVPESSLARAHTFLWCWILVYFVFFTLASTKLPNYILPLYAPVALLTARFLERWRRGDFQAPAWGLRTSLACLALMGVGVTTGLLIAGGAIDLPRLHGRQLAGLERWAILGLLPLLGAVAGWWCFRRRQRGRLIAIVAVVAVAFTGLLIAGGAVTLDAYKAPRALVETLHLRQPERDIRIACHQYFQPSLVFYCGRQVDRLEEEAKALEFLDGPLPAYLFVPAKVWVSLQTRARSPHRVLGQHRDLYRNCDVVVVTNQ